MRRIILFLAAAATSTTIAAAQIPRMNPGFEVRTFAGAYIPTGRQADDFKAATTLGAALAREFGDHMHLLGSLSWTHGHNKFAKLDDDRTYIWQYDAGVEINALRELENGWLFRPLAGLGAGARTYDYAATNVGTNTCTAAYANIGSEFQRNLVALRVDGRYYLNCFKSPISGAQRTRNDLGFSLGLVYHIR